MSATTPFLRINPVQAPIIPAGTLLSANPTATFDITGYNWAVFHFQLTWAAASQIQWYIECSADSGTTWERVPMTNLDFAAGTLAYKNRQDVRDVSASANWTSSWNLPYTLCRLSITATGETTDSLAVRLDKVVM